jgi:hypothetical protein
MMMKVMMVKEMMMKEMMMKPRQEMKRKSQVKIKMVFQLGGTVKDPMEMQMKNMLVLMKVNREGLFDEKREGKMLMGPR